MRSGRFDRQVLVDRPDVSGREAILRVHIAKIKNDPDLSLDKIASLTTGFTGADLANLVNEAALCATRRNADSVELKDFTMAIERIVAGLEKKNRIISDFERKVVAFHEMGHAIVGHTLKANEVVHKVSIIPRGIGALGYTIQRPMEDRYLMTKEELLNKISVLLAGRASEKLVFDHFSTGASDDIAKATEMAKSLVTRYGMESELGVVAYEKQDNQFLGGGMTSRSYSDHTAEVIDSSIININKQCFEIAYSILEQNKELLVETANYLLEKETLEGEKLTYYLDKVRS